MNSRLKQFLEIEQLSPAQFADKMGVQRSNISHLLSGRNKPAYDFLVKFFKTFPQINPYWLMLGQGKPYADTNSPAAPKIPSENRILPDITETLFSNDAEESQQMPEISLDLEEKSYETHAKTPRKDVRRIILYYSDGTFQEFFPDK